MCPVRSVTYVSGRSLFAVIPASCRICGVPVCAVSRSMVAARKLPSLDSQAFPAEKNEINWRLQAFVLIEAASQLAKRCATDGNDCCEWLS
jgi:hypothetical protein